MINSCSQTNKPELELLSEFLKLIAEENRLKIICFLQKNKEKCVCEIQEFLALPQNLISHHLKVLRDFHLLDYRKDGLKVYYSANQEELSRYQAILNQILKTGEK